MKTCHPYVNSCRPRRHLSSITCENGPGFPSAFCSGGSKVTLKLLRGRKEKPGDEAIFNYRLSQARHIVENVFGILCNRFRVFMTQIALCPEKVVDIVMACCSSMYTPPGSLDTEDLDTHVIHPGDSRQGRDSQGWVALQRQGSNGHSNSAKELRDVLCSYFMSRNSEVPWQYSISVCIPSQYSSNSPSSAALWNDEVLQE